MLVCSSCGSDWEIHGKQYKRLFSDRVDYKCSACKSKRQPIERVPVKQEEVSKDRIILAIPDLHFPFPKQGYLEFVKGVYDKHGCTDVVMLGDMWDNHALSFHDSDPDGYSQVQEFDAAVAYTRDLARVFPVMKVIYGNHGRLVTRRAYATGVSDKWIKTLKDVLIENDVHCHGWEFGHSFTVDNVHYTHGEGRNAKKVMIDDHTSVVQGHRHSEAYIHWNVSSKNKYFAMQLGALISDSAYAFAYAKDYKKSVKCCGVIVNGKLPIIEMMDL
jgi:hypothetical protein